MVLDRTAASALQFLIAIMLAIAAFFASAAAARAGQTTAPAFVNPFDARAGSLLLKSEGDRYTDAPRLGTDISLVVSGPTIRAKVTQVFHNPT